MLRAQKGLVHRLYLSVAGAGGSAPSALASLPTVSVYSARDGSVTETGTSSSSSAGVYYYDLQPTDGTSQLDRLTVTWSYTHESAAQTVVDDVLVVNQRLAPLQWLDDSLGRGGSSDDYLHRRKNIALAVAEEAFEEECGRAFAQGYATALIDGDRSRPSIQLPDYPVQSLISCTVDGTAVTVGDLAVYGDTGRVSSEDWVWTSGYQNVSVKYIRGPVSVPADVSRAVTLIASSLLADGPWDDRGFGVTTDGGFVRLLTAGVGKAAFSIPEVQAVVNRYGRSHSDQIFGL